MTSSTRLSRQVLLTLTAALGLVLIAAAAAWACSANAHLQVTPAQGAAGDQVHVNGQNFTSGPVRIYWEPSGESDRQLMHETAGPGFHVALEVPDDAVEGTHYFKAYGYEESVDEEPTGTSAASFTVQGASEESDDAAQGEGPEDSTGGDEPDNEAPSEESDGPEEPAEPEDSAGEVTEEPAADDQPGGEDEAEPEESEQSLPGATHQPGEDLPGDRYDPGAGDDEPVPEAGGDEPADADELADATQPAPDRDQPAASNQPTEPAPEPVDAAAEPPAPAPGDEQPLAEGEPREPAAEEDDDRETGGGRGQPVAGPMSQRGDLRPAAMVDGSSPGSLDPIAESPSAAAASADLWSGLQSGADPVPDMAGNSPATVDSSHQRLLAIGAGAGGVGLVLLLGAAFVMVTGRRRALVTVDRDA